MTRPDADQVRTTAKPTSPAAPAARTPARP